MSLLLIKCCCGDRPCRCPGCVNCVDNKTPRRAKVTIGNIFAAVPDSGFGGDCGECDRFAKRYTLVTATESPFADVIEGSTCFWMAVDFQVACGRAFGTFVGLMVNSPSEVVVLLIQVLGGDIVTQQEWKIAPNSIPDCNGADKVDCNGGLNGSYPLAESPILLDSHFSLYCDFTEATCVVEFEPCDLACCRPCQCCGLENERSITSFTVDMPRMGICPDDGEPCGSDRTACHGAVRAYNAVVPGTWQIRGDPFSGCSGCAIIGPFGYSPDEGDDCVNLGTPDMFYVTVSLVVEGGDNPHAAYCTINPSASVRLGTPDDPGDEIVIGMLGAKSYPKPLNCDGGTYGVLLEIDEYFGVHVPDATKDVGIFSRHCSPATVQCENFCLTNTVPKFVSIVLNDEEDHVVHDGTCSCAFWRSGDVGGEVKTFRLGVAPDDDCCWMRFGSWECGGSGGTRRYNMRVCFGRDDFEDGSFDVYLEARIQLDDPAVVGTDGETAKYRKLLQHGDPGDPAFEPQPCDLSIFDSPDDLGVRFTKTTDNTTLCVMPDSFSFVG